MPDREDLIQKIKEAEKKQTSTLVTIYGALYEVCSLPELELILKYLQEKQKIYGGFNGYT